MRVILSSTFAIPEWPSWASLTRKRTPPHAWRCEGQACGKESAMSPVVVLPGAVEPLLSRLSIAFRPRTFQRVLLLFVGSVLALGRHTVTRALWAARALPHPGHFTNYHRVFSRARWSLWLPGKVLAAMVLELVPPDEPVVCPVDDTATRHKGKNVYGKGRHRDNCRSTRSHTVWVWGHKWVVLAV